jgi:MFS family permease
LNDNYGHLAGDYGLSSFTRYVSGVLRNQDIFSRYGGEEFVMILPDTKKDAAVEVAERIRYHFEQKEHLFERKRFLFTGSFGITGFGIDCGDRSILLIRLMKHCTGPKQEGETGLSRQNERIFPVGNPSKRVIIMSSKIDLQHVWNKDYFLIWQGHLVSAIGTVTYAIALSFWVLDITGSTALMGIVASSVFIPKIFISPFAGALVDRVDKKWVLVGADIVSGVVILLISILAFIGELQVWMAVCAGFIIGATQSFFRPAIQSTPGLLSLFVIISFLNFFGYMVITLYLPLFKNAPTLGPAIYGLVMAFSTGGLLVGNIIYARIPIKPKSRPVFFCVSGVISNILIVFFPFFTSIPILVVIIFLSGLISTAINIVLETAFQLSVPSEYQGRVFAFVGMVGGFLVPAAMIIGGFLAEVFDLRIIIAICACILALLFFIFNDLRD